MALFLPAAVLGFAAVVLFFYFFGSVPLPDAIGAQPTVILDSTGVEIGTLQPEVSREDVALTDLPPHVVQATLAAEDADFYAHPGVSLPGIFRAAFRNVVGGEVSQGGSTISQQYIKNVTAQQERTILRKVREAALAVKLEQQYSKDEILGFYLNSIYWGRGAYGIQAAATAYYGKDARELTLPEAAQLAGIIPAPSAWDPAVNPAEAERRYRHVLDRMVALGWLEPADAGRFQALRPDTLDNQGIVFKQAPWFLDLVQHELRQRVGDEVYQGLTVVTTLDLGVQRHAERTYHERFVRSGIAPTGALVALDPATGGVRALIGGKDYGSDDFNLAWRARRQPGSTFKPFALAAWVEQDKSPESYFDAPAEIEIAADDIGEPRDWEVSNYGEAEYGGLSLREATWRSVNTVYAQVLDEVGKDAVVDVARRAGIDSRLTPVASIVLGTEVVTPLELAEAFNTFATGGIHHEPYTVEKVTRLGDTLYSARVTQERAFSEQVAWTVTDVLRGVLTRGTGTEAALDRPAAGKTGTTQNYADAWFAGYTRELTTVVWMGNRDNNQPMPDRPTGGGLPAEAWGDFMAATLDGLPVQDFPEPPTRGLVVTRSSPSPEPTRPDCDRGERAAKSSDGDYVCVRVTPSEEPSRSEQPSEQPTAGPRPGEQPLRQPAPQPTPSPKASPTASPAPRHSA
ncbi:MAG: PBP1A family penicillin-binding protein, partial [Actinomycetota bacterium]|nr:PBP1A family penicillin-binding protein [Actinomycetota bacterium]